MLQKYEAANCKSTMTDFCHFKTTWPWSEICPPTMHIAHTWKLVPWPRNSWLYCKEVMMFLPWQKDFIKRKKNLVINQDAHIQMPCSILNHIRVPDIFHMYMYLYLQCGGLETRATQQGYRVSNGLYQAPFGFLDKGKNKRGGKICNPFLSSLFETSHHTQLQCLA